jgi:DNA excision repair protein ERCC-4
MDEYLKDIFKELYQHDGLTVMGHGLGIDRLFVKFIQCYNERTPGTPSNIRKPLVFCLNVTDLEQSFLDLLISDGSLRPDELPRVINNEVPWSERIEYYREGGCYFVTSRILIVDLLDEKIDPQTINGFLLYNAHK